MAQKRTDTIGDRLDDEGGTAQTPAEFILSQPTDVAATDVVAQGKAAGLTFTESWVYKVRRAARGSKPRPVRGGRPEVARNKGKSAASNMGWTAPEAGDVPLTKEQFVQSFPSNMPAAQALELAHSIGIDLTFGELLDALSATPVPPPVAAAPPSSASPSKLVREKPAPEAATRAPAAPAPAAVAAAPGAKGWALQSTEAAVVDLILRLGLRRAERVLARVRSGLSEMRGQR